MICRRRGKGTRDIELGVRSKDDALWIHQINIAPLDIGFDCAIDAGGGAAGDAGEDVLDAGGAAERRGLTLVEVELGETVKQISAGIRATGATGDAENI